MREDVSENIKKQCGVLPEEQRWAGSLRIPGPTLLVARGWRVLLMAFLEVHHGFRGGSVVKNPPANAGNTGSIPGPGRFHMLWSS